MAGYESPRQGYQDYIYVPQGYHTPDVDYDSRDDYDQAESSGDERRAALRRQENERMRNAWIAAEQRRAQDVQRRNDPRARNGGQLRRATSHRVAKCTKGLAMHNPYDCQCSDCCDDVEFYTAAQDANRAQKICDLYQRLKDGKYFVCKVMKNAFGVAIDNGKPREARILRDILGEHRRIIKLNCEKESPIPSLHLLNPETSKKDNLTITTKTTGYNYCSAGDLERLADAYISHQAHIPESFIWHVFLQLAEAFAFIHTGYDRLSLDPRRRPHKGFHPVIHRDVKPANVFLKPNDYADGYPNLVLADFGLATTQTSTNNLIGTLSYQGPEIPLHSREGDIWSLGACIHVMCTGSPPMSRPPKGVKPRDWDTSARARVVADVTRYGYSKQLRKALYLVCRVHRSDRVVGKALVEQVVKLRDESGVRREPLAKWALKR
ncbi:MAG: hypothetical protein LQ352_003669 [Teloschistes flavicans]|nr:MAG: hypothetical protein LQ352_003669 [Teloschistes flavicans]